MAEPSTVGAQPPPPAGRVIVNARRQPKSRNGCQQCKVRKLKCDETKPACKNCLRRGNACPGYNKVLKWNTKHEVFGSQPIAFDIGQNSFATSDSTDPASGTAVPPMHTGVPRGPQAPPDDFPEERPSKRRRSDVAPQHATASFPIGSPNANLSDETRDDADVIELPRISKPATDLTSDDFQLAQSSGAKSFLRAFYRLPGIPPGAPLMDTGSHLIQHYFQDVCTIFSSFDSNLNPFRMTIARVYGDSAPIYYAIQSMAAAHLANTYPQMAMVGVEMQKNAAESLQSELSVALSGSARPDRALLALLLMGLSACWHRPNDLGLRYLNVARSLMCNKLLQDRPAESVEQQRQDQFFEEALVYWEMMMGFVSTDAGKPTDGVYASMLSASQQFPLPQQDPKSVESKVLPHPWTGVAPRAQILLAEVGRLVREERLEQRAGFFELDVSSQSRRLELAMSLEENLLAIDAPDPDMLIDVRDANTSKADFLVIAEATRCAALLDLYRIFAGLLAKRLGNPLHPSVTDPSLASLNAIVLESPLDAPSTFLFDDSTFPFPLPQSLLASPSPSAAAAAAVDFDAAAANPNTAFLNSLATHILSLIESLPETSGTRFLQLMLIVIAASELRFAYPNSSGSAGINLDFFDPAGLGGTSNNHSSRTSNSAGGGDGGDSIGGGEGVGGGSANDHGSIAHARDFVERRLGEHAARLPAKPVRRMVEIIREVWRRYDAGEEDVFWLDVVVERGWETVMG